MSKSLLSKLSVAAACASCFMLPSDALAKAPDQPAYNVEEDLEWYRDARFGLFIHWGIYSELGGVWKGERIPWIAEQIMRSAKISNKEYMPVADSFNPVKFDAEEWVSLAKAAGMKYIVITAKHHDGFAMFDSAVTDYDIVDATPYGKDVMKDLAEACRKHDIKLCFYYSHVQDWNHPDGAWQEWEGQYDQPADVRGIDFERYMRDKGLPQVRELLTNYGDIGIIWYDTWGAITPPQAQRFYDIVKEVQPNTLVNGRLYQTMGDYTNLGDNEIPWKVQYDKDYEVIATMNHTWGYKSWDHDWKTAEDFVHTLITCTSRNANYLLNVGPTGEGLIPTASVDLLTEVGWWMDDNAESIHGAYAMPFTRDFPWGTVTAKDNKLYLQVFDWPTQGKFSIRGLKSEIKSAKLLATGEELEITQSMDAATFNQVDMIVPEQAPSNFSSVIELTFDGEPEVFKSFYQFSDGSIALPACYAEILPIGDKPASITFGYGGETQGFNPDGGKLRWEFEMDRPGRYLMKFTINRHWRMEFYDDLVMQYQLNGGAPQAVEIREDVALKNVRDNSYPESISYVGEVVVDKPGTQHLEISVLNNGTAKKNLLYHEMMNMELDSVRLLQVSLDPVLVK